MHLLPSDLTAFLICFSTLHIVGSLLFKLPSIRNLQEPDLEPLFLRHDLGTFLHKICRVFDVFIVFGVCRLSAQGDYMQISPPRWSCLRQEHGKGPLRTCAILICDLPASLEDIESQCQVMSICQDVFFERPVLQRCSIAIPGILEHQ